MTTLREAVANLIAVKGRHHTEIAYQRLIEAYDAALTQPEQERDRGGACVVVNGTSGVFTIPLPGKPGGGGMSPAQSEQEPVAAALRHAAQVVQLYDDACSDNNYMLDSNDCEGILNALADYYDAGYTTPPQREWVGLTDEEYATLMQQADYDAAKTGSVFQNLRRAIEAKLREKNSG